MLNDIVEKLEPYPMEELNRIKGELIKKGSPIIDFGTGDPKIPTWEPIREALLQGLPKISQYPSIRGNNELRQSIWEYLERRFQITSASGLDILTSNGSKEAIFHTGISVVGRKGRKTVAYPNPGYPVYRSGTQFARGVSFPVELKEAEGYLLKPWTLPMKVQKDLAAVWVNYPHNPTGAVAKPEYYHELIAWAEQNDTLILSDECYVDIHREKSPAPTSLSAYGSDKVISFFSLSKRSGLTGYRSGFILGPESLIAPLARARANFGTATPAHIQAAATIAWSDDDHVKDRIAIFDQRMARMGNELIENGWLDAIPSAAFYLWCRIPKKWRGNDIQFCLKLAEEGIISTPSSWLSEGIGGYVRFSLVPELEELSAALSLLQKFN